MDLLSKGSWKDECFIWPSPRDKNGYGLTTFTENKIKKTWKVTRLIWTLTNGEIPKNMFICHRCDVPSCFNICHLFLGTPKENSQDRERKGRSRIQIGEKNHCAVLTTELVLEIRSLHDQGMKQCDIVRKFNLRQATVSKILLRTRWKHI